MKSQLSTQNSTSTAQSSNAHFHHTVSGELHYNCGKSFYSALHYIWIICQPELKQRHCLATSFSKSCEKSSTLAQCRGLFKHPISTKSKKVGYGESSKKGQFTLKCILALKRKYLRENIQHLCFLVCALTYDNAQWYVFLRSVSQARLQSHLYTTADSVSFERSNCECSE